MAPDAAADLIAETLAEVTEDTGPDVAPSDFELVLGRVDSEFQFTALAAEDVIEIVQGPQGGIHLEIGVLLNLVGPPGQLSVDVTAATLQDGVEVGSAAYANLAVYETEPGVYQSGFFIVIFHTDEAEPYAGKPARIRVSAQVGELTGWAELGVQLVDLE